MVSRRTLIKHCVLIPLLTTPLGHAWAQHQADGYPSRAIRLVVGFPPGQSIDVTARLFALKLGAQLGQTVVVDNKPGAAGIIAHEAVKNASPDGYTLLIGSGATLAINPWLYKNLPYDPLKDFTPIARVNSGALFLAVSPDVPVHNLREMIDYVKARPATLQYGSGGSGLTQHIAMEMLKTATGLDLQHIPYNGSPAMVTDLIAGRVQFGFDSSASILPHAASKRVRLIGVSSLERSPAAPDVPTLSEQGLTGFQAITWSGILAPAGAAPSTVAKLNRAINAVLEDPDVVAHFKATGSSVAPGTPEGFAKFMAEEIARWGPAVKNSGAEVN